MRIRKISQSAAIPGKIVNSPSDSTTETYSCDYINDVSVVVSPTEPTDANRKKIWMQKGKNLLQKLTDSTTVYGVTGVNNTDGSLSVTGTSTTSGNLYLIALKKIDVIDIAEGQYIISLNNVDIVETGFIRLRKYNGTEKVTIDTFPIDEVNKIRLIDLKSLIDSDTIRVEMDIVCSGINTFNFIVYPQIQAGNIPTQYEEYVEPKIYVKNDNNVYEEFMKKEEYSTSEVRIGTWIDGKPLYRKTIIGTSYLEGSISYFVDFNIIPDTFVKGYGTLNSSAIGSLQIGDISWDTNRAITYASRIEKSSDNHIKLIWTKNLSIAKYEATLEYTKTTD